MMVTHATPSIPIAFSRRRRLVPNSVVPGKTRNSPGTSGNPGPDLRELTKQGEQWRCSELSDTMAWGSGGRGLSCGRYAASLRQTG